MAGVTQIDIAHVEDHSAVSPTLLDSLAEDLSEAHPHTNFRDVGRIGVQIPSDDRGAEECSSGSSESCWGERGRTSAMKRMGALPHPPSGQVEEGGGQVGQVPEESQGTPQSVQDREPPSSVPVTTFPASSGTVRRLVLNLTEGAHVCVGYVLLRPGST